MAVPRLVAVGAAGGYVLLGVHFGGVKVRREGRGGVSVQEAGREGEGVGIEGAEAGRRCQRLAATCSTGGVCLARPSAVSHKEPLLPLADAV